MNVKFNNKLYCILPAPSFQKIPDLILHQKIMNYQIAVKMSILDCLPIYIYFVMLSRWFNNKRRSCLCF